MAQSDRQPGLYCTRRSYFAPISNPRLAEELVVEAPGYCPPGPKCLFHPTFYRHSRLPGTAKIGFSENFFKQLTNVRLQGTVTESMALEPFSGIWL